MRIVLIIAWLFVGLAGVIYHYGPGQRNLKLDAVDRYLASARQNVNEQNWIQANEDIDYAMAELPEGYDGRMQELRLEKAKIQMMNKELPAARRALEELFRELDNDPNSNGNLKALTRSALANSQYYITWLMRLEGLPKTEWEPVIESARQHYRYLAENPNEYDVPLLADQSKDDVESAIRLARMDLAELQGLPLPAQ